MNVLAFFAHPDDETMLIGGTLAILAQNGARVHYVSATRGEGGEVGVPPVCTPEELGDVREAELVCAVQALGGASLTFLGYVDPRVGPDNALYPFTENLAMTAGQVALSIRQFEPQVVITHGSQGEYGHPAHILAHQAARIAVESFGEQAPFLYTVQAMYPDHPRPRLANKDEPADLLVDISTGLARKEAAAMCHLTQHDLFTRRTAEDVGHPVTVAEVIQLTRVESLHRVLPPVDGPLDDPLAKALGDFRL